MDKTAARTEALGDALEELGREREQHQRDRNGVVAAEAELPRVSCPSFIPIGQPITDSRKTATTAASLMTRTATQ